MVLLDRERTAEPGRSGPFSGEPGADDVSPVEALDERSVEVGRSEAERVYEVRRNKAEEELALEAGSPVRDERRSCRGVSRRVVGWVVCVCGGG